MTSDPPPFPCAVHVATRVRPGDRLVDYMKDRLSLVPVTEVGDLITGGSTWIRTDGRWVLGRTIDLLSEGDGIAIRESALADLQQRARWTPPWNEPLSIHYEDDDLLVVEKPACMHVHPLGDRREHTLINALVHHAGGGREIGDAPHVDRDPPLVSPWASWRPHAVQRLDFVVSGLLAVAKNAEAKAALVRAQSKHAIERTYAALVHGAVASDSGVVDAPIGREPGRGYRRAVLPIEDGGLHAITRWRVTRRFAERTLLEISPQTGRTHQIRVHLAHLGHPIVQDALYSHATDESVPSRIGNAGGNAPAAAIALHAVRLRMPHPRSAEPLAFESPLPERFYP